MPSYLEFCSLENVKMPARIEIKTYHPLFNKITMITYDVSEYAC